jgi:hypothetical protein
VDVYEDQYYGEQKFIDLCKDIDQDDHGVQLHTHPSYAYDTNRAYMYEYTFEEQKRIIKDGKNKIYKWIQKYPSSHRAGGYGANVNTIKALEANSISIDSSFYSEHSNCKLDLTISNKPTISNNVLEIPVSVINQKKLSSCLFHLLLRRYPKYDVNYLNSYLMISSVKKCKDPYIVIFLHSSSFIKRYKDKQMYNVNRKSLKVFFNLLKYLKQNDYDVVSFSNIIDSNKEKIKW